MHRKISAAISALIPALLLSLAMLLFLLFPARYMKSVLEGISLWAACVLPAALPFLFLSSLLSRGRAFGKFSSALSRPFGKVFRVSGAGGGAAILSALSGYPVGARACLDLLGRGDISRGEVFRLACLCTTSGPVFLVGTVGAGMFSSPAAGAFLLISHFLAVWTVCLFLRRTGGESAPSSVRRVENENALSDSLYNSVISVLCVGASIALFHAFGQMISDLLPLPAPLLPLLNGLTEMTGGCALLAKTPSPLSLAGCAFFVTFGGACVLVQQLAFLTRAGVKPLPFLAVKFVQGIAAGGFAFLFGLLFYR